MVSQLISFEPFVSQATERDFSFDFGSFASTTVEVAPLTERAKAFWAESWGPMTSVVLPKSKGEDYLIFLQRKGFFV